jgi:uncharacterized protein
MKARRTPVLSVLAAACIAAAAERSGAAEPDGAENRRSISVVGIGRDTAPPDTARLSVAVEHTGPTASAASEKAAASAARVIAAIRKIVGEGGKVETAGYNLNPVYRPPPQQPEVREPEPRGPEIIGYTAVNSVAVETRALREVGHIIDAAIAAGAARVDSLMFTIADAGPVQARALRAAGADAAVQAAAIASALQVRLGPVLYASSDGGAGPIPHFKAMEMGVAMRADTPIEPGDVATEARLHVTYAIE